MHSPYEREELKKIGINLTLDELRRIRKILGREPTLCELWVFNVEWSEHCSYKSSKRVLKKFFNFSAPHVVLGPGEDAGIVKFFGDYCIVIGHESHNHPSQLLPVEGAATGIGGIVRDVDCMGAHVVGVLDALRFGDLHGENKEIVRWVADGVVQGVWEYGNALGVPNLGGDVYFSSSFDKNCLVNVVAVGILKREDIVRSKIPEEAKEEEYVLVLLGKPTDASGFGGASFASEELGGEERLEAVQVHDPFMKNVLAAKKANALMLAAAKREGVKVAFKDLGGAGLACAVAELCAASGFGAEVELDKVHKEYSLPPHVCACSETQERYILAIPTSFVNETLRIYNNVWELPKVYKGACASVIGKVTKKKRFILKEKGKEVCNIPIMSLTKGVSYERKKRKPPTSFKEPHFDVPKDILSILLNMLKSPNLCSRHPIFRHYDTEVQGNTIIRAGDADASLIAPLIEEGVFAGIALSCDGNPFYGRISPYWQAVLAVAESMSNVAAIGAVPWCLTDCLNYGSPEDEEVFYQFWEGVRGIADCARNIRVKGIGSPTPIVSGNVSFYNETEGCAIDSSPIVCCVGIMEDVRKGCSFSLKDAPSLIYMLGERKNECGASQYYILHLQTLGANIPKINFSQHERTLYAVIDAINKECVLAAHDISDGGFLIALCQMLFSPANIGVSLNIDGALNGLRVDKFFFTETPGFILQVKEEKEPIFLKIASEYNVKTHLLGKPCKRRKLIIKEGKKVVVDADVEELERVWRGGIWGIF